MMSLTWFSSLDFKFGAGDKFANKNRHPQEHRVGWVLVVGGGVNTVSQMSYIICSSPDQP